MYRSDCRTCYLRRSFLLTIYRILAGICFILSPFAGCVGYLNYTRALTLVSETVILSYLTKATFCTGMMVALFIAGIFFLLEYRQLNREPI